MNSKWRNSLLVCLGISLISLGILSTTKYGETFKLLLFQGTSIEWNDYAIELGFSYYALEHEGALVVYRVNSLFNGLDIENTIHIDKNASSVEKTINDGCSIDQSQCLIEKGALYTSIIALVPIVSAPEHRVFHIKEGCEAVLYFKGKKSGYEGYKKFIKSFFTLSC